MARERSSSLSWPRCLTRAFASSADPGPLRLLYQHHKLVLLLLSCAFGACEAEAAEEPRLIARPEAFPALSHPHCSHCSIEGARRKEELRADDRVLCWLQVLTDGYVNDGAIPLRFFLSKHRVLDDSWGQFVYDPDAGFARGFAPDAGPFQFHGWRNGVMVVKSKKDGTLYSCLSGVAFEGPRKGTRLEPRPTLLSDWGFWQKRYPHAVAYIMSDQFKPVELPTVVNENSRQTRGTADGRLPADTPVLGVWDGKQARAYPIEALEKAGVIHETVGGQPRIVLWYGATKTAAAYRQPFGTSGLAGDAGWIFTVDETSEAAPFVDKRTGSHWDITGRSVGGGPRLAWMNSVQVKWFAWAAEYPQTSIYGQSSAKNDYQPLTSTNVSSAGAHGNLDATARHFGILKNVDPAHERVTVLVEGEKDPKEWPLSPGAELWCAGWWSRLDQFTIGDRVWLWFAKDHAGQPVAIALLADELSEQALYAPVMIKAVEPTGTVSFETVRASKPIMRTVKLSNAEVYRGDSKARQDSLKVGDTVYLQTVGEHARLVLDAAGFEQRRVGQKKALAKRWIDEGLAGTLMFSHPDSHEVELVLDHEGMHWGRSLQAGDEVTLQAKTAIPGSVRRLRPWRERTQVSVRLEGSGPALTAGQRVKLRLAAPPAAADCDSIPKGLNRSVSKTDRVEWLMSSIYCTCTMNDVCAGHVFTLAACDAGPGHTCGLAKSTRPELANMIDQGQTDVQIFEKLLKDRGPKLLGPHMLP
jgi:hypothetical protein